MIEFKGAISSGRWLQGDGIVASLPFAVRNQYEDALGLVFDRDDAAVAAIKSALRHLISRKAA